MDIKSETIKAITKALPVVIPYLKGQAGKIYCETKAAERDAIEPARDEKITTERKIKSVILRRFKRQQKAVIEGLNYNYKIITAAGVYVDDDPSESNDLIKIIYDAILAGVINAETEIGFALGDGSMNGPALSYATTYVTEWLQQFDETTQSILRDALSLMPSGQASYDDIIRILEPVFGTDRAWKIAVTETTRIYAEANQIFANLLAAQYPDFKTMKRWYTNNDDRVCPICAPLNGKEVEHNKSFDGIDNPPAHVNCRCWTSVVVK